MVILPLDQFPQIFILKVKYLMWKVDVLVSNSLCTEGQKQSVYPHIKGKYLLSYSNESYGFIVFVLITPILEEYPKKIIQLGKDILIKLLITSILCL